MVSGRQHFQRMTLIYSRREVINILFFDFLHSAKSHTYDGETHLFIYFCIWSDVIAVQHDTNGRKEQKNAHFTDGKYTTAIIGGTKSIIAMRNERVKEKSGSRTRLILIKPASQILM